MVLGGRIWSRILQKKDRRATAQIITRILMTETNEQDEHSLIITTLPSHVNATNSRYLAQPGVVEPSPAGPPRLTFIIMEICRTSRETRSMRQVGRVATENKRPMKRRPALVETGSAHTYY